MDVTIVLGAMLAFVAVVFVLLGVRTLSAAPRDEVLDRVRRVTHVAPGEAGFETHRAEPARSLWATLLRPLSAIARPKKGDVELSRVQARLVHAGLRGEHDVEIYYGAKIAFSLSLAGMPFVLSALSAKPIPNAYIYAVFLAATGFYSPNVWLGRRLKARQLAIKRSLPDTLDLLVTCVEAGLGLDAALRRITDELGLSAPILAGELRLLTMETQAGISRPEAFRRLATRTGLEELRSLSAMIIQTEMFGTSIARALRVHSETMRTRRVHRAEEEGAKVAVKMMLPLILCILPSLFAVILGPAVVRVYYILLPALGGHK
jgi:tight adherence protein C